MYAPAPTTMTLMPVLGWPLAPFTPLTPLTVMLASNCLLLRCFRARQVKLQVAKTLSSALFIKVDGMSSPGKTCTREPHDSWPVRAVIPDIVVLYGNPAKP